LTASAYASSIRRGAHLGDAERRAFLHRLDDERQPEPARERSQVAVWSSSSIGGRRQTACLPDSLVRALSMASAEPSTPLPV
jgi:hypothetical protein